MRARFRLIPRWISDSMALELVYLMQSNARLEWVLINGNHTFRSRVIKESMIRNSFISYKRPVLAVLISLFANNWFLICSTDDVNPKKGFSVAPNFDVPFGHMT